MTCIDCLSKEYISLSRIKSETYEHGNLLSVLFVLVISITIGFKMEYLNNNSK